MSHSANEGNMIFYSPGRKGILFAFPINFFQELGFIEETISRLENETGDAVTWVEERRRISRA